jgi:transcriptional regulator with XRE-family HTH domain
MTMPTKRDHFLPTVRARYLGQRMREFRDDRGLTLKFVATYISVEFSTLARYERAEWPFRADHVEALLNLYGVHHEPERRTLTELAHTSWHRNHWHHHDPATEPQPPTPYAERTQIEAWATDLYTYHTTAVPPLLQTPAYADAVLRQALPEDTNGRFIANTVQLQMTRQREAFSRNLRIWAVLDETILHRPYGGTDILAGQHDHLDKLARNPNIDIRILPTNSSTYGGTDVPFTVYGMGQPYPPVAYLELPGGALLIEGEGVTPYTTAHERLRDAALNSKDSSNLYGALPTDGTNSPHRSGQAPQPA